MIYIWCYALCRACTLLTTRMPELWLCVGCGFGIGVVFRRNQIPGSLEVGKKFVNRNLSHWKFG